MSGSSVALIAVGLFFAGGVISFAKQGISKSIIAVLAIGAVLFVTAGLSQI
ncbi:MAG: hypothetical protein HOV66_23610 [Streptomycetaceae bacterium]|jgi:hypothetical protein|uniref:Amidotransferase n=1 Tax=Yinghuangia aomiensis TaxID=676205 RepID=A0ABP9GYY7_9ACTN|nr:hypothetical protein [Streptomycetaceae bacterium]NUS57815.1 hypothetical protein [Streptomycetaceae bacterium]